MAKWRPWRKDAARSGTKKVRKPEPSAKRGRQAGEVTREDTRHVLALAGHEEGPIETTPDVLLDVPTVKVDEISLEVDDLRARVSLHAELANLVRLDVGAEVEIDRVSLTIKGVEAQALLKVRLQRVYEILNRALQTVDANPELLTSLLRPLGHAVSEVGEAAHETLRPGGALSNVVGDVGAVAKEALAPDGALTRVVGDVGDTVKVALGPGGVVHDVAREALAPDGVVGTVAKDTLGRGGVVRDATRVLGDATKGRGQRATKKEARKKRARASRAGRSGTRKTAARSVKQRKPARR
ncbi:hypothetical protein SAMN05443572_11081 [Myxococcus fulvus]|uniref:Uncharacterized protein n=1 Tax=Myxococcus fulvus TaxID=33 RepID=A0A511T8G5_MYXFU|nr:hypothetical protein [Myxococcus fulvus]GEN10317.1 hypothetical protein MFU01_53540 [Myxococcus fulvus]SEU34568.1 hypothetical protein SAMN05443572_11081 [Myxococcus fulvus]